MKKYIAPKMELVDLRVEERMAGTGSVCDGQCHKDVTYDGYTYRAGQKS